MTNKKIILGIAAGISAGIIAGILLSPDKGSATRKKILDKADELGGSLKDCLVDFLKGKNETKVAASSSDSDTGALLNTMG
jgi:gas vesicle protein